MNTKEIALKIFEGISIFLQAFLPLIFIIIITVLIVRAVKKNNEKKWELERYKAETERIKAEAMRDRQRDGQDWQE